MPLSDNERAKIAQQLAEKGATAPCPRCSHGQFAIVGESFISLNDQPGTLQINGPGVPVYVIACERCGYTYTHAKLALQPK